MAKLSELFHRIFVSIVALLLLVVPVRAEDCSSHSDFNDWVECLVKEAKTQAQLTPVEVDSRVERASIQAGVRSNRNQAETPSMSGNSTSLIDTSSASDLISLAANLAGLSDGTEDSAEEDATTASATASTYALYSAASTQDPLDPQVYCAPGAMWWRSFWVTLGFDDQENGGPDSDNPIVVGAKFRPPLGSLLGGKSDEFFFRSDVCDWKTKTKFATLRATHAAALDKGADAFGELVTNIGDRVVAKFSSRFPECASGVEDPKCFQAAKEQFGEEMTAVANAEIQSKLQPFLQLDESIRENVEALNGQGDFSLAFTTKQRGDGADEYSSALIFEHSLVGKIDMALNASHEFKNEMDGEDSQGGRVAAAFVVQPFPDLRLAGPKPLRFTLAGEGEWMENEKPLYKGQLKVNLPIPFVEFLSGLEIPLSVTIANRTDLIDETEVRGMIGFTLDTAQVLAEARRRFLSSPPSL